MNLARTTGRLALRAALVALGVVLATFVLLQLVPGDVTAALLGSRATPESVAALRAELGLDLTWYERLANLFADLFVHGGGVSLVERVPVADLIQTRIGLTLTIVLLAMTIAILLSVALALVAALNHDRLADHVVRVVSTSALAFPAFLVGMLLILVFSVHLRWVPVGGASDGLRSLILPSFTAALGIVPVLTRSLRVQMLQVSGSDFLDAARSAGMRESRVVLRHLLPNAAIPALTLIGLNLAYLIGGTFIVEKVFAIPGLGTLMFDAIGNRDVVVVQALVAYTAIAVVAVNLATESVVRVIDPRFRRGRVS
ncbi:ABC transporter permease [Microbacterium saperdae]